MVWLWTKSQQTVMNPWYINPEIIVTSQTYCGSIVEGKGRRTKKVHYMGRVGDSIDDGVNREWPLTDWPEIDWLSHHNTDSQMKVQYPGLTNPNGRTVWWIIHTGTRPLIEETWSYRSGHFYYYYGWDSLTTFLF